MSEALPVRMLLLEDSAADAELIVEALRQAMRVVAERVDTEEELVAALDRFAPDVVLADHSLAAFDATAALRVVHASRPGTPVMVVTGALREEMIVGYMRAGAEDLVLKNNLGRLAPAIEKALQVRQPLERLSPRQREVFRLMAAGSSTPAIARELGVSAKTVESHRAEVMRRLGIRDLAGVIRYAVRIGILLPEG